MVPTSYIGPVRGDRASYMTVLLLLYIFPLLCHVFRPKSLNVANSHRILKPGGRGLRDRFVRVTLVPCKVLVPLTGPFCGYFLFSAIHAMLFSLSLFFFQILVIYSNRESGDYAIGSYELHCSRGRFLCLFRDRFVAVLHFHPLTPSF